MAKIGIIGGRFLLRTKILKRSKEKKLRTQYGSFSFFQFRNSFFILRHGKKGTIPPHQINYKANLFGLKKLGVKYIFSFNSVGSLKLKIKPGHFLIPDDYIDFDPPSFFEEKSGYIIPSLSEKVRRIFIKITSQVKGKFWESGVYFNSKGPRLETKAEIKMMKNFADVVGMTMAKEATLAQELDLEYASLCAIDNFAHGIGKKSISIEEIFKNQEQSAKIFEKVIEKIINENFD